MADTLESLEIEVKHKASGAETEINKVTDAIKSMSSALAPAIKELKQYADTLGKVGGSIKKTVGNKSSMPLSDDLQKRILNAKKFEIAVHKIAEAETKMNEAFRSGDESKAWKERERAINATAQARKELEKAADEKTPFQMFASKVGDFAKSGVTSALRNTIKLFGKIGSSAKSGFEKVGKAISGLKDRINKAMKPLNGFLRTLGRIAFYRAVRSIIKAITDAMKEGLENAYAYSQGITTEGHRFSTALDAMSSAALKMKNQLGAAFIAVLSAIQPIVNVIINLITKLADTMAQFFSTFTGGTYLKAKDIFQAWADTSEDGAKAAKEWKNQLMGFDEINKLEEPSNSGSGKKQDTDPMLMFEDTPISDRIKEFADNLKQMINSGDWEGLGMLIADKINSIFPNESKWKAWGSKLGKSLSGVVQTMYHALKGTDFKAIGKKFASFLNGALGDFDSTYLGRLIVTRITSALDFLIGYLGTLQWGLVGQKIGDFFRGAFDEATGWLTSDDKNWSDIGTNLFNKFSELISGIDFASLAQSFFELLGAAFAALTSLLSSFFEEAWDGVKSYFSKKTEEAGGDAWEGFKKGVLDAWKNIKDWCKENVIDPFIKGVVDLLGIEDGEEEGEGAYSKKFKEIGINIVQGMKKGFLKAWEGFKEMVWGMVQDLIDGINNIINGLNPSDSDPSATFWDNGYQTSKGPSTTSTSSKLSAPRAYAYGGWPNEGELFLSRESGPEMVGTIGGRTAVATNQDIVAAIEGGVYNAMMASIGSNHSSGGGVVLNINGREFMRAIWNDQKAVASERGMSLLANG